MTEVVTSSAAAQQLNLLAPRQQAFVVERQGVDAGFATADTAATQVETPADTFAQSHSSFDDQNPVNRHQDQTAPRPRPEPAPAVSGPSKARIEIKHIDLGLTPSEVVGTPDILQRFDTNGDGRVDLIEAARAGQAREGVFTFAGLAAGQQSEQAAVLATSGVAVEAPIAPATSTQTLPGIGDKKLFTASEIAGNAQGKKLFVAAHAAATTTAAQGAPTGTVDAPKKFYGQGAEVVVGKFAAPETTGRFADQVVTKEKVVVTEDGTGETKLYDKVAQTDTDQTSDSPPESDAEAAKAARQAAAAAQAKKVVLVEVAAYADASTAADAAPATTAVTA